MSPLDPRRPKPSRSSTAARYWFCRRCGADPNTMAPMVQAKAVASSEGMATGCQANMDDSPRRGPHRQGRPLHKRLGEKHAWAQPLLLSPAPRLRPGPCMGRPVAVSYIKVVGEDEADGK